MSGALRESGHQTHRTQTLPAHSNAPPGSVCSHFTLAPPRCSASTPSSPHCRYILPPPPNIVGPLQHSKACLPPTIASPPTSASSVARYTVLPCRRCP